MNETETLMLGVNYVNLKGYINYPKLTQTQNGSRYQANLQIPVQYTDATGALRDGNTYVPISAWGATAEGLSAYVSGTFIEIFGRINIRKYDSPCKGCGEVRSLKWTDVIVDNFEVNFSE